MESLLNLWETALTQAYWHMPAGNSHIPVAALRIINFFRSTMILVDPGLQSSRVPVEVKSPRKVIVCPCRDPGPMHRNRPEMPGTPYGR